MNRSLRGESVKHSHRTPAATEDAILEVRRRHPFWGPKKLLKLCRQRHPERTWPARSTICSILKRNGLVPEPRRRRRPGHPGRPMKPMNAPNEIWTADFKGEFRLVDLLGATKLSDITRDSLRESLVHHDSGLALLLASDRPRDMHLINQLANYELILKRLAGLSRFLVLDMGVGLQPFAEKTPADVQ